MVWPEETPSNCNRPAPGRHCDGDRRAPATEQVESLGAKFLAVEDEEFKNAQTAGGTLGAEIRPHAAGRKTGNGKRESRRRRKPLFIEFDDTRNEKPGMSTTSDAPARPPTAAREGARRCEGAGLLAEADMLYRLAANLDLADRASASASLARVLIAAGELEEARPFVVDGNDSVLMAVLSLEAHDFQEARRLLDEARNRDPFDPRSASARGRLSFLEKRFPEAVADLLESRFCAPKAYPTRRTSASSARRGRSRPIRFQPGERPRPRRARDSRPSRASGRRPSSFPTGSGRWCALLIARGTRSEGLLDRARRLSEMPALAGMDDHSLLAAAGAGEIRRPRPGALSTRLETIRARSSSCSSAPSSSSAGRDPADGIRRRLGVRRRGGLDRPSADRAGEIRGRRDARGIPADFLFESPSRAAWLKHLRMRLARRLAALNALFEHFFPGQSGAPASADPSRGEAASVSPEEKAKFLSRGGFSESDRYLFGAFADERQYPAEALIFREGDAGDALYTVARGRVRISRRLAGGEEALAILGPGEIFGEMAVLDPDSGGRSADARAHEEAVLLELRQRFERLERSDPEGSAELSALLCRLAARRCAETAERLARWRMMAGPMG